MEINWRWGSPESWLGSVSSPRCSITVLSGERFGPKGEEWRRRGGSCSCFWLCLVAHMHRHTCTHTFCLVKNMLDAWPFCFSARSGLVLNLMNRIWDASRNDSSGCCASYAEMARLCFGPHLHNTIHAPWCCLIKSISMSSDCSTVCQRSFMVRTLLMFLNHWVLIILGWAVYLSRSWHMYSGEWSTDLVTLHTAIVFFGINRWAESYKGTFPPWLFNESDSTVKTNESWTEQEKTIHQ